MCSIGAPSTHDSPAPSSTEYPLISIVVPTFNRAGLLGPCIDNLLEQDYPNFEIVLVNDGSTDETESILAMYDQTSRVRSFSYSPNKGACFARNFGVSKAKGSLIAFQDSDDLWSKDKLSRQYNALIAESADLVFCGMERRNPATEEDFYYPDCIDAKEEITLPLLLEGNCISTQTILITAPAARHISFDVTFKRYQDWDYALQAVKVGLRIRYLAEPLVSSTVQDNSISATVRSADAYEHIYRKYEADYSAHPVACAAFFERVAHSYRGISSDSAKRYLLKSLTLKPNIKVFLKLVASSVGLY